MLDWHHRCGHGWCEKDCQLEESDKRTCQAVGDVRIWNGECSNHESWSKHFNSVSRSVSPSLHVLMTIKASNHHHQRQPHASSKLVNITTRHPTPTTSTSSDTQIHTHSLPLPVATLCNNGGKDHHVTLTNHDGADAARHDGHDNKRLFCSSYPQQNSTDAPTNRYQNPCG